MKKQKKTDQFLNEPLFVGGKAALDAFIAHNVKYPDDALELKLEGDVHVKYDLNHKGKVIAAVVTKGLFPSLDAEALRLVNMLRFECKVPRGMKVVFHQNITIHFKLPRVAAQPKAPGLIVAAGISYTVTSTVKKPNEPQPPNGAIYTYTVSTK